MIAFLFPGQGSQYTGMGADFCAEFVVAKRTFEEAGDAIGVDVAKLCFEGEAGDSGPYGECAARDTYHKRCRLESSA